VDILADTEKKRIKCQHCAKTHEIPDEGFPKILALQKLLECEAKEVSHSNQMEEFKKLLDTLNVTKQSIESTMECGDATIRDHCDKARNDMQLAVEQAHAKLDEFHKDFMDEIDAHEKECQAKFKSIKQNKADIDKTLHESNELLSKSNNLLNQFKIEQTELATLFESAQSLLAKLEATKDGIQREMFNESLLKFERPKSFDSILIGKIIKQNIELYFLENIGNMREIDFNSKIKLSSYFPILFTSNNCLLLRAGKNVLNFLCLDKEGNTLIEKKYLIKNQIIEEFIELNAVSTKNNKILYIITEEQYLNIMYTFYNLRSFDENFNLLAKIKLDEEPENFVVNGENLFLLFKNENFCTMSMYNPNLEIVQTFGQENSTLPYFFPPYCSYFLVSDKYFIFDEPIFDEDHEDEDYNRVTTMNRSNGLVEHSFVIMEYFDQMKLYLDKYLITFNSMNHLKCYNFKGDLLCEITLDKKLEGSDINVINKELCFILDDKIFIC